MNMRHHGSNGRSSRFSSLPTLPGWLLPVGAIVAGSLGVWGCDGGRVSFGDDAGRLGTTNGGGGGGAGSAGARASGAAGRGGATAGGTQASAAGSGSGAAVFPVSDLGSGNDPTEVHPWPMAHQSAGNQSRSASTVGTDPPFARWFTRIAEVGDGIPSAPPLIDASGRIYASSQHAIVVVDAQGAEIARVPVSSPRGIAVTKSGQLVVSDDTGVRGFVVVPTVTQEWHLPNTRSPGTWVDSAPVIAPGGDVFVVDAGQDLIRVDVGAGGIERWRRPLANAAYTPALAPNGGVYVTVSGVGVGAGVNGFTADGTPVFSNWGSGLVSSPFVFIAGDGVGIAKPDQRILFRPLSLGSATGPGEKQLLIGSGSDGFDGFGAQPVDLSDFSHDGARVLAWGGTLPTQTPGFLVQGDPATYAATWMVTTNPHQPREKRLSTVAAVGADAALVFGYTHGGLTIGHRPDVLTPPALYTKRHPAFRVPRDENLGTPSPSIGPGGDIYFTTRGGLLFRLGTTDNPCAGLAANGGLKPAQLTPGRETDAFVGELINVQAELGLEGRPGPETHVTVGGVPAPLRIESSRKSLHFDVPPMVLPEGGQVVDIEVVTPATTLKFCRRILPRPPIYGDPLTITDARVDAEGAPPGIIGSGPIVVEGSNFPLWPEWHSAQSFDHNRDPAWVLFLGEEMEPQTPTKSYVGVVGATDDMWPSLGWDLMPTSTTSATPSWGGIATGAYTGPGAPGDLVPGVIRVHSRYSGHPAVSFPVQVRLPGP